MLVSLAILTIVSIALLLLFNQSFDGIIKSGKKAKMIYGNQETLETMISSEEKIMKMMLTSRKDLKIYYSGIDEPIESKVIL